MNPQDSYQQNNNQPQGVPPQPQLQQPLGQGLPNTPGSSADYYDQPKASPLLGILSIVFMGPIGFILGVIAIIKAARAKGVNTTVLMVTGVVGVVVSVLITPLLLAIIITAFSGIQEKAQSTNNAVNLKSEGFVELRELGVKVPKDSLEGLISVDKPIAYPNEYTIKEYGSEIVFTSDKLNAALASCFADANPDTNDDVRTFYTHVARENSQGKLGYEAKKLEDGTYITVKTRDKPFACAGSKIDEDSGYPIGDEKINQVYNQSQAVYTQVTAAFQKAETLD